MKAIFIQENQLVVWPWTHDYDATWEAETMDGRGRRVQMSATEHGNWWVGTGPRRDLELLARGKKANLADAMAAALGATVAMAREPAAVAKVTR